MSNKANSVVIANKYIFGTILEKKPPRIKFDQQNTYKNNQLIAYATDLDYK